MSQDNARPPAIDALLEEVASMPVPLEVETRLRARLHALSRHLETTAAIHRRPRRLPVYVAASLAAAVLLVCALLTLGGRDAWAQVVDTLRAKPWVHCTLQIPAGAPLPQGFQAPEGWFSVQQKIGARRFGKSVQFVDLARQEAREYQPDTNTVSLTSISDNDNIDFGHLETVLRLVAENAPGLKRPHAPIALVDRAQREVREGERRLVEFTFQFRDPRRTPTDYTVTLRVDPQSRLPLDMTSTEKFSREDPAATRTYVFDYPDSGPVDIYALGVPRDAAIVDRRRPKPPGEREIKELFAAYQKAQRKTMGPYSAVLLVSDPVAAFTDTMQAYQVRDDGVNRSVTRPDYERLQAVREQLWSKAIALPAGIDPALWWKQEVANLPFGPLGGAGGDDRWCRPDGFGDSLSPDYAPMLDDTRTFTLDPHPTSGPAGTILFRVRADLKAGFNEDSFWIAPERDYMVLRHELAFSRNPADSGGILTWVVDKAQQAPGGRWYVTEARIGRIEKSGDDLSADRKALPAVTTSVYRFLVDFK